MVFAHANATHTINNKQPTEGGTLAKSLIKAKL